MYLNFFTCCSVFPFACSAHWLGFPERLNISVFLVLFFLASWSHAAENKYIMNTVFSGCKHYEIVRRKQTAWPLDPIDSNRGTIVLRVAVSEVIFPTPTSPKFPTP